MTEVQLCSSTTTGRAEIGQQSMLGSSLTRMGRILRTVSARSEHSEGPIMTWDEFHKLEEAYDETRIGAAAPRVSAILKEHDAADTVTDAEAQPQMAEQVLKGEKAVPVLYVDLDGTVRHGPDELGRYVHGPDDVVIFPEAVDLMRRWKMAGGRVAGVSNAGGVALGEVEADQILQAMVHTQELSGFLFDLVQICFHNPGAAEPENARCWCRKPSAGAVAEAVFGLHARYPGEYYPPHLALFVGDRDEDRQCAENAMIDFMWAREWRATAFSTNAVEVTGG